MKPQIFRCLSILPLGLLSIVQPLAAQTPTPAGGEFQVNAYTTNNQWRTAVATSASGDFVVTWSSTNQDGSSSGVFAQRYDASGAAIGGEFQVNTTTIGSQSYPGVGMDADGNLVIVWSTGDVFAQRYDASGTQLGGEFTVNSYLLGSQFQPAIAMNHEGDFVVAWNSDGQDGSSFGVFGQLFDATGSPVASEFQANTTTASYQIYPTVGIADSGEFVVVWNHTLTEVYGQRFTSSGTATGSEFHVNTTTSGTQRNARVDFDLDGDFVVAWRSYPQDGDGDAVIAQRYASDGTTVGGEFQVNTYTTGSQSSPQVARAGDGDMVVIWSELSNDRDGDQSGTFGQLLDDSDTPVGSDFQVNSYTSGRQIFSALAMDDAGNFVATWVSDDTLGVDQDGDQSGVFAQRFVSPCSETVSLPTAQWKMLSLPCDPGASDTVADVFGDDMTGTYGTDWIVYERDEAAGSYVALTLASPLEAGVGYWIKTNDAGESVTVGSTSPAVTEVDLAADSGGIQNLVGHPFDFDVCWGDVRVIDGASVLTLDEADPVVDSMRACDTDPVDASCVMSRTMYKWDGAYTPFDGGTPGAEGTLESYDALWVKAFKSGIKLRVPARGSSSCGGSLRLPPSGGTGFADFAAAAPGGDQALKARPLARPWGVRLIAEGGGLRDAGNLFGQLADSTDDRDLHDLKELAPFAAPYLTVVFPQPDWGSQAGDYATDFHALRPRLTRDAWVFEVRASPEVAQVTLTWDGPRRILRRLRLIDRITGERVPMRPGGSYTYATDGAPRVFSCRLRGRQFG